MPDHHELLLPHDTDEPEFTRGFEAGRIWGTLRNQPWEVSETAHASNAEMFIRMGEALGRTVRSEELEGEWIQVIFGPAPDP